MQPGTGLHDGAIGIAGAGALGPALGRLLAERGEPVVAVASRTPERAQAGARFVGPAVSPRAYRQLADCPRILVAVSDAGIAAVARALAEAGLREAVVLHTCGAFGPEALQPLPAAGVSCGALHPLQTVPSAERGLERLPGVAFGVTAEGNAAAWAHSIVRLLGGRALRIPAECRPLYHAAAVLASNYVTALHHAAVSLLSRAGVGEQEAAEAIAPLLAATLAGARASGAALSLTGPIRRGDARTVGVHLDALCRVAPDVEDLYRAAGRYVLRMARAHGLPDDAAGDLARLLADRGHDA